MNSFGDLCDSNNSIAMQTSNLYVQRNIKHKIQLENDAIFPQIFSRMKRFGHRDKLYEQRRKQRRDSF